MPLTQLLARLQLAGYTLGERKEAIFRVTVVLLG